MAITSFTAPATTATDTIVARMVSDGNLVGVQNSDFSLHRSDTDAVIPATISQRKTGNFFWDVTAQLTGSYFGDAYLQIRANAFRDLQTLSFLPSNPLRSNVFAFVATAPTNFTVSDGVNTAVLRWDAVTGTVYETRRDGGAWQDATSPLTITELSADTEYVYELRVKGEGNGIAMVTKRTLVYPIEAIDEQFIPINTENYELIIGIVGQHADARVTGLQEGFYQHFENLSDGNSRLYIRAAALKRLLDNAIWSIHVSDTDWEVTQQVTYNVVPVGPIFVNPGRQTIYKGVPFRLLVEVLNNPSVQRGKSELVGLVFTTTTIDERAYIESEGMLPTDANLTFSTFNVDYYIENPGGNDSLQVPIDIRDDAVAPTISRLRATYTVQDGAAVNIPFTVTATPEPVVTLADGLPDWLQVEHVSGTNYRIVGTSPGAGNYELTVVATGLGVVTHDITMIVQPPPNPIAPVINAISNVSRTWGYSQFTIQASLSSGTTPTWDISGIAGATISQSGLITIPAGLGIGTYNATVNASNRAGSDRKSFSLVVAYGTQVPTVPRIRFSPLPVSNRASIAWQSGNFIQPNGSPIIRIEYSLNNGQWQTSSVINIAIFTSTFLGFVTGTPNPVFHQIQLSPGTYSVRVRAVNQNGASDPSNSLTFTLS